ncbi:ATP-binding protein [Caulobacter sp. DWP3-1-3b2]|uniref:ATP-binding protein n=1 Tax=Caulobacter sp. DWP3-1-3b2 TaxID=2804643 RepID=UPI003CEAAD89
MTASDEHDLARLLSALADRAVRASAAASLANHLGAQDLLILLRDPELGVLRPAPGFRQTLAGGPTWTNLLARCGGEGAFRTSVAYPHLQDLEPVDVCVGPEGTVLVLIGGAPRVRASELAQGAALVIALLQSEARVDAALASAHAAGDASRRATALAGSLDQARAQLAGNALALREALSEAARLNSELRLLNETLEQRVQEEIADRLKAEEALRQAQKMEAIGQLTGGVAHDFNNLLTVIIGGLDNMARNLNGDATARDDRRLRRSMDMALQSAQRAAILTGRLLAFSRRQPLDPKPLQADRLVRDIAELLQRAVGEHIDFEVVASPGLWPALADPNELEQALLNLAVNARDAMPDGGKLTIETANVFLDEAYLATVPEPVSPGQYVLLAVSDTGEGMDSDTLLRVFEPFFTTKETGKGTGLGLSQVYGFVRQSGGHVRMYSEAGHGTTAKLYLPRSLGDAAEPRSSNSPTDLSLLRGTETVLLIEDDENVRAYSSGVLRELGYCVLEASDARTALAALDEHPEVQLLFTDVVLPGGTHGGKLADEARRRRPGINVLFTSGYTRNAIVHNGRLDPGVQLITKPFTYEELAERVRRGLDGR